MPATPSMSPVIRLPMQITFDADPQSLAIADRLAVEQGLSLEEIAAAAFSAYADAVRETMRVDLDEDARNS